MILEALREGYSHVEKLQSFNPTSNLGLDAAFVLRWSSFQS